MKNNRKIDLLKSLLLCFLLFATTMAFSEIIYVNRIGDDELNLTDEDTTLRRAITIANENNINDDTIIIKQNINTTILHYAPIEINTSMVITTEGSTVSNIVNVNYEIPITINASSSDIVKIENLRFRATKNFPLELENGTITFAKCEFTSFGSSENVSSVLSLLESESEDITIENCSFYENTTLGAVIYIRNPANETRVNILNTTFYNNQNVTDGSENVSDLLIESSVNNVNCFLINTSFYSGLISENSMINVSGNRSSLRFQNSLFQNTGGVTNDVFIGTIDNFLSLGHNIARVIPNSVSSDITSDPGFDIDSRFIAHDGNYTRSLKLLCASPAINSGTRDLEQDQNGVLIQGGARDRGAHENLEFPPVITNTNLTNTVCSGEVVPELALTANTPSTYNWAATTVAGVTGYTASGTSNIPSETYLNPRTVPVTIDYTITPTSTSGCTGVDSIYSITINPSPKATLDDVNSTIEVGSETILRITLEGTSPWDLAWTDGVDTSIIANITSSPYQVTVRPTEDTDYKLVSVTSVDTRCSSSDVSGTASVEVIKASPTIFFPNAQATYGDSSVNLVLNTSSLGQVDFTIINGTNTCGSLDITNPKEKLWRIKVSFDCVDTILVGAIIEETTNFASDTVFANVFIAKKEATLDLKTSGGIVGDTFLLNVTTDFDQPFEYTDLGDTSVISFTADGRIVGKQAGETTVILKGTGSSLYEDVNGFVTIKVFEQRFPPIIVDDTLTIFADEEGTIDVIANDTGVTGSIVPELVDLEPSTLGIQSSIFDQSVGFATVDDFGVVTFRPETGYVGEAILKYTITDENGETSAPGSLVLIVSVQDDNNPLSANEVITPNNDLKNDVFFIEFINPDRENLLIIYDVAGNEVYSETDYGNNWNGIDNSGDNLIPDVYYYSFKEFNSDESLHEELTGIIQIVR